MGMFWISLKLEMRRPFKSTTGVSPPRPRSLRVSGDSSCSSSVTVLTPKERMSAGPSCSSGLMSPTTAPGWGGRCAVTVTVEAVVLGSSASVSEGWAAGAGVGAGVWASPGDAAPRIASPASDAKPRRRLPPPAPLDPPLRTRRRSASTCTSQEAASRRASPPRLQPDVSARCPERRPVVLTQAEACRASGVGRLADAANDLERTPPRRKALDDGTKEEQSFGGNPGRCR